MSSLTVAPSNVTNADVAAVSHPVHALIVFQPVLISFPFLFEHLHSGNFQAHLLPAEYPVRLLTYVQLAFLTAFGILLLKVAAAPNLKALLTFESTSP